MKYFEKKRKPIPFLEDLWRDDDENGRFFGENTVSLEGRGMNKTLNSHNKWGKNKEFLKTALKITLKAQNTHFSRLEWVANKSPSQAAKNPCDKFWKICLNVFHNLKVHLWVSREGSREPFWVRLATGASTREQVAKLSRENAKNLDFWNFSKSFLQLRPWLARESPRASV